ncbi:hypothetical protein [Demequina muriae]|uniref:Uncharacterized protein n=1 Tax=Demequina muriae TaxID=3051664 RepID=A0ABT8GK46_9MICO|nr:hypothetical protein [Demequina sp. EGI L300058]MDN4481808.1 hypothetical protein [Demequina sp. EGI L300058]
MDALADRLTRGPRGRRLLLELLTSGDERAREAAFFASRGLSDSAASFGWAAEGTTDWEPPKVTASQAADALAGVEPASPDGAALLRALRETVDDARYWQPPGGEEVLASQPELDDVLAGMARVVAVSPAAAWLDAPLSGSDQHRVRWPTTEREHGVPGSWEASMPAAQLLGEWSTAVREEESTALWERPADPSAAWSGTWWSVPPLALVTTTRSLRDAGPAGLHLVEDSFGEDRAVTLRVTVPQGADVLEIACAEDWAALCRRHSIDVTASRRHDWFSCTGRAGDWVIPDWEGVSTEHDAVHLTAAAYLEASRVAIRVDDGRASVIAGWNPDATVWLRDVTIPASPEVAWMWPDGGEWCRA